jgi:ferritin
MAMIVEKKSNPMISEEACKLLNYRITQEEASSRLYLGMSMWLNDNGYLGAAKKWKEYSEEEMTHANWAREYLLAMGDQPSVPALPLLKQNYEGLPEIIRASYNHEIVITRQCQDLAAAALKMGDHLLYQLALKYLHEQVEEHGKMQDLMDKLDAFGTDKIAMRLLDNELGS